MDIDRVESLVKLVSQSTVTELTVRIGAGRISVRRAPGRTARKSSARRAGALEPSQSVAGIAPDGETTAVTGMQWVTAPLVGIFFHAEPPVSIGAEVKPGQVIGVIESMKLMNEVRSDFAGVVVESAIEAGMAVEYGQPLFAVRSVEQEAEDGGTN